VREHLAFGRGAHSCPGAPLARAEAKIAINRILDRMRDISIAEDVHGTAESRSYEYEVPFVLRGLAELHVNFTLSADKNDHRPPGPMQAAG
jgi:cytochrome P450